MIDLLSTTKTRTKLEHTLAHTKVAHTCCVDLSTFKFNNKKLGHT